MLAEGEVDVETILYYYYQYVIIAIKTINPKVLFRRTLDY